MKNSIFLVLIILLSNCTIKSKEDLIISQIKKTSKLSTLEVVVNKNLYNTDKTSFFKRLFTTEDKNLIVIKTEAKIKLGIDMSKLRNEDVKIRGTSIYLKLPPVEITNFSYPAENFEIDKTLTDKENIFSGNDFDKLDKLFREAELDIRNKFELLDMRKKAEEKTSLLLKHLLQNLGFDNISIEYYQSDKKFAYNIDSTAIAK
jgi:hypothetical protein